mmetsp:Transcript_24576/g.27957  ORF Transcript_24576/g.27957 Transcript_24576/m.27957 type:complete len:284 (+) Transcript_24576:59-910(+)
MSKSLCSIMFFGIFLLTAVQATVSSDDATSDCQDVLVSCYEKVLQDFDQDAYGQCQMDAFNKYGMDVCIPCAFAMKVEYVPELPKISSPDIPVSCLSACRLKYFQKCTSIDQQYACASACYPPPTSNATEECQEEILDCVSAFLDSNDQQAYSECSAPVLLGYGYNTCMPCLLNTAESVALESNKFSTAMSKECALDCVGQFMDDCNMSAMNTCLAHCPSATSITTTVAADVVVGSQNSPQSYASWSLIGAALACVSVFAGMALWRNNQKIPEGESQYHQLLA